jgi:hypothetical protein
MLVKATREGLIGQMTATGWKIDTEYPFVALPSHKALGMWISLRNLANGKHCCAQVLDVGPWNTEDDAYVFSGARPLAETGTSISGHATNGAGIDLGEKVWGLLGMTNNGEVEWLFVA